MIGLGIYGGIALILTHCTDIEKEKYRSVLTMGFAKRKNLSPVNYYDFSPLSVDILAR